MINAIAPRAYQPRAAFRGEEDYTMTVFTPEPRQFMVEYLKKDIKKYPELKDSPLLQAKIDNSNKLNPEDNFVFLESHHNLDAYKALKTKVYSCAASDKVKITSIAG